MPAIEWIKLTTTMFDDEKIQLIESLPEADTVLIIWVKLLTLAGKCNASGHLILSERIAYTEEMLATVFRRNVTSVRMALKVFQEFGMIELDETLYITNWEKHQNVESLDRVRKLTNERVKKHRKNSKLKLISCNVTDNVTRNADVTGSNATEVRKKEVRKKNVGDEKTVSNSRPEVNPEKQKQKDRFTWFKNWFVWAIEDLTGAKYVFSQADGPLLARLLKATSFNDLLQRGSHYLTLSEEIRFPRGAPTIKGFNAMFNQLAGKDGRELCQADGLLPIDLQQLRNFTPWKEGDSYGRNAVAA